MIRQNILFFAFGLNGLAIVLAGLRVLGPVAAAIFHQVGSLLVLLNAIRLLGFERWESLGIVRVAGPDRRRPAAAAARRASPTGPGRIAAALLRGLAALAVLAYLGSGITVIGPEQVGVLRRWGRFQAPAARPRPAPAACRRRSRA